MMITAVVVTYNRLQYLKKVISALNNQSKKLDSIIVVNNGSTDGTKEWLSEQTGLFVINQENVGGSGGFYRGIKEAFDQGFDWIWCMDDDVYPREDRLRELLSKDNDDFGIFCPKRIMGGKIFNAEFKKLNLSNPFRDMHQLPLTEEDVTGNEVVTIEAMAFEGPLIKREVVEKIGLPNKDLFIIYDDTDYAYRCTLAGFKVVYVPTAIIDKENFISNKTNYEIVKSGKWKLWYSIRNGSYFRHHYGKNIVFKFYNKIPTYIHYTCAMLFNLVINNKKYEWKDIIRLWSMYKAGLGERLGKM